MYDLLSPGVQVKEIDYSDYVANASSSIVGMVGGARRGPTEPTLITSQEDMIKVFGEPSTRDYGVYSALEALTQTSQLYYQRVCHQPTAPRAGTTEDRLNFIGSKVGTELNDLIVDVTYTSDDDFEVKVTKDGVVKETFENCALSGENLITAKINGISEYIIVRVNDGGTLESKQYTLIGGTNGASYGTAGTDTTPFKVTTKYYDSTLNNKFVEFKKPDAFGYIDMYIYDEDGTTVIENINDLSLDPNDERYVEIIVNKNSSNINIEYNPNATDSEVTRYVIQGGSDGMSSGEKIKASEIIEGLRKFSNPEVLDINILCAPGWSDKSVINEGILICENRGDSIFIIDTPMGLTPQQANDWANAVGDYSGESSAIDNSYGAIYYPWIKVNDTYTQKDIWLPPSGLVCAQYAYSDKVSQPWYAPAGLNRGMVTRAVALEYSTTKGERDAIYGNRNVINPIINYMGQGICIWGQKTTQRKATALDRVNVRRLMNYLKKIITASTAYYVFEPNDEHSWDKWVDMVEPKLENIKTLRGIYDYKVEMRPTADEIENNVMPGTIWVKPTKSAEFIPLNFMIAPYSANFEDLENS